MGTRFPTARVAGARCALASAVHVPVTGAGRKRRSGNANGEQCEASGTDCGGARGRRLRARWRGRFRRPGGSRRGAVPGRIDPIARGHFDIYARTIAKIELADAWFEEHGYIHDKGAMPAVAQVYTSLLNTAGRALERLQGRGLVDRRDDTWHIVDRLFGEWLRRASPLADGPAVDAPSG